MVYIPKKTLHIRHEGVTSGSSTRCTGRYWWGTDAMMYNHPSYSSYFTQGDQTATANLTGTRQTEGNITFSGTAGNIAKTWGFPAGTFKIEWECLVTLNSTADPAKYRIRSETTNTASGYSPQILSSYSLEARKLNLNWHDYTENSTNYRLYKQEFELTSTPTYSYGWGWNDNVNLRFAPQDSHSSEILTMPFEDVKITQLD